MVALQCAYSNLKNQSWEVNKPRVGRLSDNGITQCHQNICCRNIIIKSLSWKQSAFCHQRASGKCKDWHRMPVSHNILSDKQTYKTYYFHSMYNIIYSSKTAKVLTLKWSLSTSAIWKMCATPMAKETQGVNIAKHTCQQHLKQVFKFIYKLLYILYVECLHGLLKDSKVLPQSLLSFWF